MFDWVNFYFFYCVVCSVWVLNEFGVGKVYVVCFVVVVFVFIGLVNGVFVVSFIYLFWDVWGNVFISDLEVL